MKTLNDAEISEFLSKNPEWALNDDKLTRVFKFKGFGKAMDFMQAMRAPINTLRHHPEWSNVYNQLSVSLTTHDAGGITKLDLELANVFNDQFGKSS